MKQIILLALFSFTVTACSKNESQNNTSDTKINLLEIAGKYSGSSNLYGPVSCSKTCGMSYKVIITDVDKIEIFEPITGYFPCGLFAFPVIKAQLIKKVKGIYYFRTYSDETEEYRIWNTDTEDTDEIKYNIALATNGAMDGRLSYYSKTLPQGNQVLNFEATKK